jgi:hypothetical protein
MPRRPWTEDELKRARKMRAAGHAYREIDKALGRRTGAAQQRLERISDGLFAEREALAAAREQRTLSQDLFGDPPPSYSALHGKTGQR